MLLKPLMPRKAMHNPMPCMSDPLRRRGINLPKAKPASEPMMTAAVLTNVPMFYFCGAPLLSVSFLGMVKGDKSLEA